MEAGIFDCVSELVHLECITQLAGVLPISNLGHYTLFPVDRREREEELRQRRQTMDDILRRLGFYEEGESQEPMTEGQAVRLIQIHERARQGRLRAQFMREIRLLKEKGLMKIF